MSDDTRRQFPVLSSNNYSEWAGNFKAHAKRKNFYRLLIGQEKKPSADTSDAATTIPDWEKREELASGELYLALDESQKIHIKGMEDEPVKMWKKLEEVHIQKRPATRFNAYSTLLNLRKEDDESLTSIITRVDKALIDIKAIADASDTVDTLYQDLASMALIRSLPAQYDNFVSSVVLMDKFSYTKVQEAFRLEEHNRLSRQHNTMPVSTTAHAATSTPHECDFCGVRGHIMKDCYKFAKYKKVANQEVQDNRGRKFEQKDNNKKNSNSSEFAGNASYSHSDDASTFSDPRWTADTGATSHMTPHRHFFATYEPLKIPIRLADESIVYSAGVGSVRFQPVCNGSEKRVLEFERVLHVPKLRSNLLSVLYLTKCKGYRVIAQDSRMMFHRKATNQLLFSATVDAHFTAWLDGHTICISQSAKSASGTSLPLNLQLWHRRFSHLNHSDVKKLASGHLVTGLQISSSDPVDPICEPCLAGKQHRTINKVAQHRATRPLELIHSDLHGPLPTATPEGYRYWITFIDDYSRFVALMMLKHKSDAFSAFKQYKAWIENKTGLQIKALRDDKGGEYMLKDWDALCLEHGIERQHTVRNEPHQNGVAERANRTIAEGATAMLTEAHLPGSFWGHAVTTFIHTHNRSPTSALNGGVPYTALFKQQPDVSYLRVFGCTAYVHIQKDKRKSLESHTERCIFIGYPTQYKGWQFYNPVTKKMRINNIAEFDERSFPGLSRDQAYIPPVLSTPDTFIDPDDQPDQVGDDIQPFVAQPAPQRAPTPPVDDLDIPPPPSRPQSPSPPPEVRPPSPAPAPEDPPAPRRSTRAPQAPTEWWKVPNAEQYRDQVRHRDPAPIIPSDSDSDSDDDSDIESANKASSTGEVYPNTYAESQERPDAEHYHTAVLEELESLIANGTFEAVDLPKDRKAIGCRWVFNIKRNVDATIERYKARLVAKGFSQRPGFDYTDTFAPTVNWSALRAILAFAAINDMEIEALDISSAFLNGDMDTEVYMQQPEGFPLGPPGSVLRLLKGLYGLKQAGRLWWVKLDAILTQLGFKAIKSAASIWVYERDGVQVILPVFVDDMLLVSKSMETITRLKEELSQHLKFRDLGPASLFLGVAVTRDRPNRTLHLSQRQYILDVLERFGMSDCNPVSTPLNSSQSLSKDDCPRLKEEKEAMSKVPYSQAVGSLMYLAIAARPDISHAVGVLSRFSGNPGPKHWTAVKHVLRYLKGTLDYTLSYSPDPSASELFTTYSDADFAGNKDNGRSTGAFVVKIGSGVVSWRSKLQSLVAHSTTEAEYISAFDAAKEVCWLRNLFRELGCKIDGPSTLHVDNRSAIAVANNPEHHGRMKHMDLRYYWLRDLVASGLLKIVHCPTTVMPADLLTKALERLKVSSFVKMLGLGGR